MRVRDPESKKRQLLDAALIEFAATGLIGTKVEAIARRAQCSAGLVYTYFGSKEALFDAVLVDITKRTVDQTPINPEDLPGYAVHLYDGMVEHPKVERFVAWYQLERDASPTPDVDAAIAAATSEKIALVAAAQEAGKVSARVGAAELVLSVQAIARMWSTTPVAVVDAVEAQTRSSRREMVRSAVTALVAPH
ncbi:MAG: transcriptional regulator, TetR family [Marmoricola sp.]|nr:transcriptional regulator, TetR family [Marmoricola sp.]